jgi:hypothetical protein
MCGKGVDRGEYLIQVRDWEIGRTSVEARQRDQERRGAAIARGSGQAVGDGIDGGTVLGCKGLRQRVLVLRELRIQELAQADKDFRAATGIEAGHVVQHWRR